ncbi:chromate transporter [Flammeovirga agarivorans]|uniref:Chromate transporter n=1 Tax=Flammeovirga agarivorans TaxID=2726742 RepID=A0A7X8SGW9_9BACT|nr:chromate transporter [Flammeovirga agarivorans]NLR90041.1 chromate transporter [Flammeovirga agarivorans]
MEALSLEAIQEYFDLFITFCKIGFFSFGGGLAMVPLFVVEFQKQGWMKPDQFYNVLSLAQMTPGAIAVNSATYVGNQAGVSVGGRLGAIIGGVFSTSGLATPSVVCIVALSEILKKLKQNKWKQAFFFGIKPVTIALILFAGWKIAESTFFDIEIDKVHYPSIVLCIIVAVIIKFFDKKIHPIALIAVSAILGIVLF